MKQLLLLDPPKIQSGIWKGVGPAAVPLWADGNNIAFRRLGFERTEGAGQVAQLAATPRDLTQAYVAGEQRVYAGTDLGIELAKLAAGIWSVTSLHSWPTAGTYADLETWGTWLVGTNGINPVVVWKNTGTAVALGGVAGNFTTAKILKRKTPFLFAVNTSVSPTTVNWSSDSDIEVWTPTSSNKAGSMDLRDMDSEILAVEDIGDRLAFYSRSSLILGTFVGGQAVWGFKRAIRGVGAISRRSVVTVDPYNYGLTQTGIFKTDGNSFTYLDDPAMVRWYRDTADFTREANFWGVHDAALKCVSWQFQDVAAGWHSISYYYEQNLFSSASLPMVAGAPQEVLPFPVVADPAYKLGLWTQSQLHFGVQIPFNMRSKPLDFGERTRRKLLQMVRVDGDWDPSVMLTIRAYESPTDVGSVVWNKPLIQNNYPDFEAAYFGVEFSGAARCYVSGIEFFGEVGGLAI